MPKRGSQYGSSAAKRRRTMRKYFKRPQATRFINQLGGWSTYPHRRTRPVIRYFSSQFSGVGVTYAGVTTKEALTFRVTNIPDAIRNTYQRVRIMKCEIFIQLGANYDTQTHSTTDVQIAISRALQQDGAINPLNVPGAQIKILQIGQSISSTEVAGHGQSDIDVIRAARMYPPINVATQGTTNVGLAPITKENWLSTSDTDGAWDTFNIGIYRASGSTPTTYVVNSYYTITLLCDGQKA